MRKGFALSLLLAVLLAVAAHALPGGPYPSVWANVAEVLDGNTIVVSVVGSDIPDWIAGSVETVRYIGSLAEGSMDSFCGALAREVNRQMTLGRLVYLEFDDALRDADGALLAYVYLDGGGYSMVNAALVALGMARAHGVAPNVRYASVFAALEATAMQLGIGCLYEE